MGDNGKKGGAHAGRPQGRKMASITKSGPTRIGLTRYTVKDPPLPEAPKPHRRRWSGRGKHALGAVRQRASATPSGATTPSGAAAFSGAATGGAADPARAAGRAAGGPGGRGRPGGPSRPGGAAGPGGMAGEKVRMSRKERRAERAARTAAAEAALSPAALAREQDRQLRRRRHVILVSGLIGLFVLTTGGISAAVYIANLPPAYYAPAHISSDAAGIVAGGSGHVKVDLYVDFACPTCQKLESTTFPTLNQMISRNQITLIYHPVALLDGQTTNHYSTRAASSAACASDRDMFLPYVSALFAAQPQGRRGLSDDQLIQIAGSAGIIDPNFAQCVRGDRYKTWVDHATSRAGLRGVTTTPAVMVNGALIAPPGRLPTLSALTTAVGNAEHAAGK